MAGEKTKKIPKLLRQGPELTQKSDQALPLPLALPPAPQSPPSQGSEEIHFSTALAKLALVLLLYPTSKRIDSRTLQSCCTFKYLFLLQKFHHLVDH